jgi:hypothetical protein
VLTRGIGGYELDENDHGVAFKDRSHTEGVVTGCLASPRYGVGGNHGFFQDVGVKMFCPAVEPGRRIHQEEPLEISLGLCQT